MRRLRAMAGLAVALLMVIALLPMSATAQTSGDVRIEVLGNRADLISGGDALVEISLPGGASPDGLTVDVDGRDVTNQVVPRENGRVMGLVTGLTPGVSRLTATLPDGRGANIDIRNNPQGGPLFSGPHLEPWECTTADHDLGEPVDDDCNAAEPRVWFEYRNHAGTFSDYDPNEPPPDAAIAMTTTDNGETVKYIVRRERGTQNRGIYDLAVIWDPERPWEPWAPQEHWNRKAGLTYGSGCAPGYSQASPEDPMLDDFLSRGFVVGASSMAKFGNSCSHALAAEASVMLKERMTELLGEVRYTIGNGCSGGAEGQHTVAENFPGVLDGIRPECTFADGWTPAIYSKAECFLLEHYFNEVSPHLWGVQAQREAVLGHPESQCLEMQALGSAPQDWDPTTGCIASGAGYYDPEDDPGGARCTLQDLHRNVLGTREDGFANGVLDHVGVQWGLQALYDGAITLEQFLDINENIGGVDIDFNFIPERTRADIEGIENFYKAGLFTYGTEIAKIPNIDTRTENSADFHGNVHRDVVRARITETAGHHDNQVYWFEPYPVAFGLPSPFMSEKTLVDVDRWLTNIEQDDAPAPSQTALTFRNKPEDVTDGCYPGGQRVDGAEPICEGVYQDIVLPRIVAGMPLTANVLKCQLKPVAEAEAELLEHGIELTDDQSARLRTIHPEGVCDWSKPGVGQREPIARWLSWDTPGGRALGPAPVSVPFRTAGADDGSGPGAVGPLPATGGGLAFLALVLLALTGVIRRR